MKSILAALALLSTAGSAAASGALGCTAEDKAVKFDLAADVTHGAVSPISKFHGTVEIGDEDAAQDLRRLDLSAADLSQYWLDAQELRLLVRKRLVTDKPSDSADLEIKTLSLGEDNEGHFEGGYKLTIHDLDETGAGQENTLTFTGKASCFAE